MGFSKYLTALTVLIFSQAVVAKDFEVTHKIGKDETAWFLSQVFYGKGADYKKILEANNMKSPDELVTGKEIRIRNPLHHPEQKNFTDRYTQLWEKREKVLEQKRGEIMVKEVVVASGDVRKSTENSSLPFTEVKDPNISPVDKAKEELQKLSEQQMFKRTSDDKAEPF